MTTKNRNSTVHPVAAALTPFARLDDHMAGHEGPKKCKTCGETIHRPYVIICCRGALSQDRYRVLCT
jgi:hypothetical protein